MGAVAALEWALERRPRRRGRRRSSLRALAGGQLQRARPEPADARRAAADDRRRPRRGAARSSTWRWSTRTAAARCSRSPACTCGAGSRCSGAATCSTPRRSCARRFDQAEAWGYGADTLQWNAAHLAWCLAERGDLAGARKALMRARERGGSSDGARYWCNARLELLVAEGRYEDAVEAGEEYARRFARYHNPAAARWSSLQRGRARRARDEAQGDRARRRGARPRARLGRARHGRPLAARARARSRAPKGSSGSRRPSRSSAAPPCAARAGQVARRARRHAPPRRPARTTRASRSTRAHELAEVCGAERLLAQIRTEMLAVGVEPASAHARAAWAR